MQRALEPLVPVLIDGVIQRESARALDQKNEAQREREQMILIPFAFLIAGPVHKKAKVDVDHGNGHQHVGRNAKDGDATEEAEDEGDASEELREDGEKREQRGNVHSLGEVLHGAGKAIAAEPAQNFLRSMHKKDGP